MTWESTNPRPGRARKVPVGRRSTDRDPTPVLVAHGQTGSRRDREEPPVVRRRAASTVTGEQRRSADGHQPCPAYDIGQRPTGTPSPLPANSVGQRPTTAALAVRSPPMQRLVEWVDRRLRSRVEQAVEPTAGLIVGQCGGAFATGPLSRITCCHRARWRTVQLTMNEGRERESIALLGDGLTQNIRWWGCCGRANTQAGPSGGPGRVAPGGLHGGVPGP